MERVMKQKTRKRQQDERRVECGKKDFSVQHSAGSQGAECAEEMHSDGSFVSDESHNNAYYETEDPGFYDNNNNNNRYGHVEENDDDEEEEAGFESSQVENNETDDYCSEEKEAGSFVEEDEKEYMEDCGVRTKSPQRRIRSELQKHEKDLKECRSASKGLEKKYLQIDFELNELQHRHQRFIAHRKMHSELEMDSASVESKSSKQSSESASCRIQPSIQRLRKDLADTGSFVRLLPKVSRNNQQQRHTANKPNDISTNFGKKQISSKPISKDEKFNKYLQDLAAGDCYGKKSSCSSQDLKNIYNVLNMMMVSRDPGRGLQKSRLLDTANHISDMPNTELLVEKLQAEQVNFQKVINEQKQYLNEYQMRCNEAQKIIKIQQIKIEELSSNNRNLESEIVSSIEKLREQVESKIEDTAAQKAKLINSSERGKYERISRENTILNERLRKLQKDLTELKTKLQDHERRKNLTLRKLKTTQRELKIFRDHNESLKQEKGFLHEELKKTKSQLNDLQTNSKRTLTRQTDVLDRQRRALQKRVQDLEIKLKSSQNLASSMIQERDRTIAELRTQLNSMVHNFEVSQKHICLLKRQMQISGGIGGRGTQNGSSMMMQSYT